MCQDPNKPVTLTESRTSSGNQLSVVGKLQEQKDAHQFFARADILLDRLVKRGSLSMSTKHETADLPHFTECASFESRDVSQRGITMNPFETLMSFARETREQQQKYLETVRSENAALIERYQTQTASLVEEIEGRLERNIERVEDSLGKFKTETLGELTAVRYFFKSTIITILLSALFGFGGVIYSIWATAPKH